jgi:hypothetical protein
MDIGIFGKISCEWIASLAVARHDARIPSKSGDRMLEV